MVRYLCHWEVESNLFLLNRTILVFPNRALSLPDQSQRLCAAGRTPDRQQASPDQVESWSSPGKSKWTTSQCVVKVSMRWGAVPILSTLLSSSPFLPSPLLLSPPLLPRVNQELDTYGSIHLPNGHF